MQGEDEELLEEAEEEEEEGGVGATGGVDDELTEMKLLQQENANESAKVSQPTDQQWQEAVARGADGGGSRMLHRTRWLA